MDDKGTSPRRDHVLRLREQRQRLPGRRGQDEETAPRLRHAELSRLQDGEGGLVAELDEGGQAQLQHQALLETGEVTDILQDEELRTVEITVAEVGGNQAVFELTVLSVRESVHLTEALARWSPAHEVHRAKAS